MDNPPPSDGRSTDSCTVEIGTRGKEVLNQVKTGESSSKLVEKKRRNLEPEAKNILKQWKKVKKSVADFKVEARNSRMEMEEMVAATVQKEKEVKFEKEKRDGFLAAMLLMSGTEHVLMETLFPPSGNC